MWTTNNCFSSVIFKYFVYNNKSLFDNSEYEQGNDRLDKFPYRRTTWRTKYSNADIV